MKWSSFSQNRGKSHYYYYYILRSIALLVIMVGQLMDIVDCFDYTPDCVVSRTVSQQFARDLATCVSSSYKRI